MPSVSRSNTSEISFVNEPGGQGIYLLCLKVATPITVTFGRFQGGRPIPIPAGDYLYVGSALGRQGATTLAGRLLRHTTRSGDLPPHTIQTLLQRQLHAHNLLTSSTGVARPKRLFWHIDYLVDRLEAEISHIIILATTQRLESTIAHILAVDPVIKAVAPGLGASDDPHATHLFRVDAPAKWWHNLPERLTNLLTTVTNIPQVRGTGQA